MKVKSALCIPDTHHPACDLKAYYGMLSLAKEIKIDEVIILGDFLDFWSVSFHDKEPNIDLKLVEEIEYGVDKIQELSKMFPKSKKVFLEGNHSFRLERYIAKNAKEFFGLVKLEKLLGLKQNKFEYHSFTPNQGYYVMGTSLLARHCPYTMSNPIMGSLRKGLHDIIFGHVHSMGEQSLVVKGGKEIRAIAGGWLGNEKDPVFSYIKDFHRWNKGFYFIHRDRNNWWSEQVKILENKMYFRGKTYSI